MNHKPRHYVWHGSVACRTIDDTAFILLDSRMVSLNATGTLLWNRFRGGASEQQAVACLVGQFAVEAPQARVDVRRFVDDMLRRGLLVPTPPAPCARPRH